MPVRFLCHTFITVHSILGNRMVLCWYKDKRNGCFLKNNCSFISDKKMTIEPWLYYFISDYSFYSSMYASNMGTTINISFCYWKSTGACTKRETLMDGKSRISQVILVGSVYVRRHLKIFLRSGGGYVLPA